MPRARKPSTQPFRRTQVVSPVPSERRFAKAKFVKRLFDVYVTDIETGDETYLMSVNAASHREAIQIVRKRMKFSPILRAITHAAFTAVEVEAGA